QRSLPELSECSYDFVQCNVLERDERQPQFDVPVSEFCSHGFNRNRSYINLYCSDHRHYAGEPLLCRCVTILDTFIDILQLTGDDIADHRDKPFAAQFHKVMHIIVVAAVEYKVLVFCKCKDFPGVFKIS